MSSDGREAMVSMTLDRPCAEPHAWAWPLVHAGCAGRDQSPAEVGLHELLARRDGKGLR
jgi:hypothetical protein